MKFCYLAVLSSSLVAGVKGLATPPQDIFLSDDTTSSSVDEVIWPISAKGHIETNAERMARGLTPSRPRNLINGHSKSEARSDAAGIAKRLINAPPSGRASPSSTNAYTFKECYSSGRGGASGTQFFTLQYTTVQDLVNQCAAKQDQQTNPTIQGFVVDTTSAYTYPNGGCVTGATSNAGVACTASNYAAYVLQ